MKVKLKKLNDKAVLPSKAREGDFCYDVVAVSEKEVAPNLWEYGLGFAYEIVRGRENLITYYPIRKQYLCYEAPRTIDADFDESNIIISLDFRPRSSVWKTGMILSNCEGTLDEFYRGEVKAYFYHVLPTMPRYKVGDRIGQIKLGFTLPIQFEFVKDINMDTERGEGGFGSTGN